MKKITVGLFALFVLACSFARAQTISSYDGGSSAFLGIYGYGQSVLTPSGGPWTNITFGFLDRDRSSYSVQWPENAVGQLFVFTQEYTGSFAVLGQGVAGYLATGTTPPTAFQGLGNQLRYFAYWEFDSSLVLAPNTRYYFYATQGLLGVGQNDSFFDGPNGTNQAYTTASASGRPPFLCGGGSDIVPGNCNFAPHTSFNYVLTGVVPEPETYAMLLAGLGLLGFVRRRATASRCRAASSN